MQLAQVDIGQNWRLAGGAGQGGFASLSSLVSSLLPKILLLGGVVAFVLVIIAGIGVISAAGSGDSHGMENRKNFLLYAVIGLVIMFGAFWILQIINFVTGGSLQGIL
jgi:succinate dehydrogenase/fumarate reductase cytochrome b subunit